MHTQVYVYINSDNEYVTIVCYSYGKKLPSIVDLAYIFKLGWRRHKEYGA